MSRKEKRKEVFKRLYARELDGQYRGEDNSSFIRKIVDGVVNNKDKLDKLLNEKLEDWRMERVYPVEKVLLRMGLYELIFMDTERAVVINEAVELAKIFGNDDTPAFVNGILDDFSAEENLDEEI